MVIVPLAGYDAAGHRLGYGGGFYDRTLQALRARGPVTAIGLAFACQQVGAIPAGPHDQPLDLVVTDRGIVTPVAKNRPA
ncbi:5-formyltetrahydrofolate cyclo-ligase [Paracoccus aestuarii]|uniref:5-formyltetrahydrofolate cyclo-ligase n=1 Tax=Paracoccus aestuarii TaxID=453842 RepID=UPI00300FC6D0